MRTEFRRRSTTATIFVLVATIGCTRERDPMERLAAEIERLEERPTVARISGFAHRPTPRRVVAASTITSPAGMRGAAAEIVHDEEPSSHASAVASLLMGQRRRAVDALAALVLEKPADAALWNDLAAARYELAAAENDLAQCGAALAAADRALRIDPTFHPALFNRALALAALALEPAAVKAFEHYRAIDTTSGWSDEALQRLQSLRRPSRAEQWTAARAKLEQGADIETITRTFAQQARTFSETEYLGRWAHAFIAGNTTTASHWLAIARAVGAARVRHFGDSLLADAVRSIDASTQPAAFAEAHGIYQHGRKQYATESGRVLEALASLEIAERKFEALRSPMGFAVTYYRANVLFDAHRTDDARAMLERLLATTPVAYRSLRAQLLWLRSTITGVTGAPYASLTDALEAAEQFRQLGEYENAARMEMSASTALRRLGRLAESQEMRRRAFRSVSITGKPSLWEVTLNGAARDELLERRWDVAAAFFAVEIESDAVSPLLRFDALLWRALAEAHVEGSVPNLDAASAAAARIADPIVRADVQHELLFAESTSIRHTEPNRAAQLLTRVIAHRIDTSSFVKLSAAYVERARAHRQAGRPAEAEADLRSAIEADARVGRSIAPDDLRDTFFGGAEQAYDELIELLVAGQRLEEAADIAERRSERGEERHAPAAIAAVQRDVMIVRYTALSSGTLISVIRDGVRRQSMLASSSSTLQNLGRRLLRAMHEERTYEMRATARELYDALIAPIDLQRKTTLVIVPDETIAEIPFAMLISPSGRFLVEDFVLVHSSSASMFLQRVHEPSAPALGAARVAVISDPQVDPTTFPRLERLPAARRDAQWLAQRGATLVLAGSEATPTRVMNALRESETAYIAAHAIANRKDAWDSLLALAPEKSSDGALYLREIANEDLRNLRLVVLAGCSTASMGGGRGSVRSLARAFLAAGAHNAVATLWDVEDSATSAVMQEFVRALDRDHSPAAALREAQLAMLRSADPLRVSPKNWASLQLQGRND